MLGARFNFVPNVFKDFGRGNSWIAATVFTYLKNISRRSGGTPTQKYV